MINQNIKTFGTNLQYIREDRKLTFKELSKKAKYDRQSIPLVEYGEKNIKFQTAFNLAKALDVSFPMMFSSKIKEMDRSKLNEYKFQDDDFLMVFAANIKRHMSLTKLSQAKVADMVGLQYETVSRILTGTHKNPYVNHLAQMATAAGTNLYVLFTRK